MATSQIVSSCYTDVSEKNIVVHGGDLLEQPLALSASFEYLCFQCGDRIFGRKLSKYAAYHEKICVIFTDVVGNKWVIFFSVL